ncbi:MAG: heme o synthase [Hyphomicrobiaceae bacterium]|nr:heme o synthase [Hyphomicrobiaceae bacterium]
MRAILAEQTQSVTHQSRQLSDYLALTKPAIVALLLLTTLCGMILGASGFPPISILILTLLGGALTAGGAGALNQYNDRDIDRKMVRTRGRPVADERIPPREALIMGFALSIAGVAILAVSVNILSAVLAVTGLLYYVVFYTIILKPSTPSNIVIGGAAGALPPLVGWAAVTGSLSMPALFLFALIFFWTPPHFWALALYRCRDYERAGVPMLPVVAGAEVTRRQIWLYSLILVPLAITPVLIGLAGIVYGVVSAVLGAVFLYLAWKVRRITEGREADQAARRLFVFSILYLFLLFAVLLVEHAAARWIA